MSTKTIKLSDGTDTLLPESAVSGSNYCKMADGTLIQWGTKTIPANASNAAILFSIPFVGSYSISITGNYSNSRALMFATASEDGNGFTAYKGVSDLSYAQLIRWLCIGRWK